MKRNLATAQALIASSCLWLHGAQTAVANDPGDFVTEKDVANALASAKADPGSAGISDAWNKVRSLHEPRDALDWREKRDAKLVLMLRVRALIQARLAEIKPPEVQATINVGIPGVTAGSDPAYISDPALRRQYEEAIARNQRASEVVNARAKYDDLYVSVRYFSVTYMLRKYVGPERARALELLAEYGARDLEPWVLSGKTP